MWRNNKLYFGINYKKICTIISEIIKNLLINNCWIKKENNNEQYFKNKEYIRRRTLSEDIIFFLMILVLNIIK